MLRGEEERRGRRARSGREVGCGLFQHGVGRTAEPDGGGQQCSGRYAGADGETDAGPEMKAQQRDGGCEFGQHG